MKRSSTETPALTDIQFGLISRASAPISVAMAMSTLFNEPFGSCS